MEGGMEGGREGWVEGGTLHPRPPRLTSAVTKRQPGSGLETGGQIRLRGQGLLGPASQCADGSVGDPAAPPLSPVLLTAGPRTAVLGVQAGKPRHGEAAGPGLESKSVVPRGLFPASPAPRGARPRSDQPRRRVRGGAERPSQACPDPDPPPSPGTAGPLPTCREGPGPRVLALGGPGCWKPLAALKIQVGSFTLQFWGSLGPEPGPRAERPGGPTSTLPGRTALTQFSHFVLERTRPVP